MDENVSRPISALQIVLKLKTRFSSSICTQSQRASNRNNRHYLGNLAGSAYLKNVTTESTYTRNRDISVIFPLIIRTKDPGGALLRFSLYLLKKNSDRPQTW